MQFKSFCSRYSPKALCRPQMTSSTAPLPPSWFTCSDGTGNFCQPSLPNSCPEPIWFPSGLSLSLTYIANGSRSRFPGKKLLHNKERFQGRKSSSSAFSNRTLLSRHITSTTIQLKASSLPVRSVLIRKRLYTRAAATPTTLPTLSANNRYSIRSLIELPSTP